MSPGRIPEDPLCHVPFGACFFRSAALDWNPPVKADPPAAASAAPTVSEHQAAVMLTVLPAYFLQSDITIEWAVVAPSYFARVCKTSYTVVINPPSVPSFVTLCVVIKNQNGTMTGGIIISQLLKIFSSRKLTTPLYPILSWTSCGVPAPVHHAVV